MTESSKNIVRRFLSAAQQGDMATAARLLHPGMRVTEADSLPFGGVVTGVEGFTQLVRRVFTTFVNTAVTIDEYIADGDTVVVLATMTGQSKASGEAFSMPISETWRLRDGLITEIRPFYYDTQKINSLATAAVDSGTTRESNQLANLTDRFREFHRLSLSHYESYPRLYSEYLKTGMRLFDMPAGIVSRISDEQYTVLAAEPQTMGLASGDTMPLGETYCSVVVRKNMTMAVAHTGENPALRGHPAYLQMPLGACLATPIRVNGEIYGTLNFTSPEIRKTPFDASDVELIELMAGRIGQIIEQNQLDREKQTAISQLHENTVLFESAFEYAAIGMGLLSTEGRWLRVNRAVTALFGYTTNELLALDFQALTHPDDLDTDLQFLREMLTGQRNTYRMQKRYFHKDGHQIWALLSVSLVRDENNRPEYFVSQIQDITAQKHAEAELQHRQQELESLNRKLEQLSTTDPLTQLGNRRALDARMREELPRSRRSQEPLSLLMVDVDHFKRYNDTYGHLEGDVALRKLASVLTKVARINDTVIRLGGEEFTLLLPHTDEAGCCTVAKRLARLVAELEGLEAPITVSTGGATLVPAMGSTRIPSADAFLKLADDAMYRAKQEGRNRHCQAPLLTC